MELSIIIDVILPYAITTFADMRTWAQVCKRMYACACIHGNINDTLGDITYQGGWVARLPTMKNIKRLHVTHDSVIGAIRQVEHLSIDMSYHRDLSHLSLVSLKLNHTHIDTTTIPQLDHLEIRCHCTDINIGHLTRLQTLHVVFSDFDLVVSADTLTTLTTLILTDICDDYVEIPFLPNLRKLHMREANDTHNLRFMTNLTDIDVVVNDEDIRELRSLTSLTVFKQNNINMTTLATLPIHNLILYDGVDGIDNIGQLSMLRSLTISDDYRTFNHELLKDMHITKLRSYYVDVMTCLTQLRVLEITGSPNAKSGDITALTSLTHLGLINCGKLTEFIGSDLITMTNLRMIDVSGTSVDLSEAGCKIVSHWRPFKY